MARSSRCGPFRSCCVALLATLLASCGFPDYTYDLPEDGGVGGGAGADAKDVSIESGGSGGGSGGSTPDASDARDTSDGPPEVGNDVVQEDVSVVDTTEEEVVEQDVETEEAEDVATEVSEDVDAALDVKEGGQDADAADVKEAEASGDAADAADVQDVVVDEAAPPSECQGVAEDCSNGVDDDCDNKVDCQDTDCSAYKCVTPPPAGWTGFFQLYEGPVSGVPNCQSPFSTLAIAAGRDPVFQPATCSTCQCGNPTNVQCSEADFVIWENGTCAAGGGWSNFDFTPYGSCKGWNLQWGDGGAGIPQSANIVYPSLPIAGTGFCSPSGGVPTLANVEWSVVGAACQVDQTGAGCVGTSVCAPKPLAGFKTGICIYRTGVISSCPAGAYTSRYLVYQSYNDTRGCSTCACDSPANVTCHTSITVALDPTCAGTGVEATVTDSTCQTIQTNPHQYLKYTQDPTTGGTCNPSGGASQGTVVNDTATAYTFCCSPF